MIYGSASIILPGDLHWSLRHVPSARGDSMPGEEVYSTDWEFV